MRVRKHHSVTEWFRVATLPWRNYPADCNQSASSLRLNLYAYRINILKLMHSTVMRLHPQYLEQAACEKYGEKVSRPHLLFQCFRYRKQMGDYSKN